MRLAYSVSAPMYRAMPPSFGTSRGTIERTVASNAIASVTGNEYC